jgi:hypothetical protein
MCQVLIGCAYVDLNKFIDIIHLNQIKLRHVVPLISFLVVPHL